MTASVTTIAPPNAKDNSRLIFWGVSILTTILVFGPLVPIFIQAFLDRPLYDSNAAYTTANFVKLVTESGIGKIFLNTLYFGALTMVVAQVFGAIMAVLVGRTNMPGRRWLGELFVWPLFVSNLIIAFGWITMYGPSGYMTLMMKSLVGGAPWNL